MNHAYCPDCDAVVPVRLIHGTNHVLSKVVDVHRDRNGRQIGTTSREMVKPVDFTLYLCPAKHDLGGDPARTREQHGRRNAVSSFFSSLYLGVVVLLVAMFVLSLVSIALVW